MKAGLKRAAMAVTAMIMVMVLTAGCTHMMMMVGGGPDHPAPAEFGYGPRTSASGRYQARLVSERPLVTRQLQRATLILSDSSGAPVDSASIAIGGGMPQHGHGLPTQPRVTAQLGAGSYQIDGLKFNMGGWWVLKFRIAGASADSIVFNLAL